MLAGRRTRKMAARCPPEPVVQFTLVYTGDVMLSQPDQRVRGTRYRDATKAAAEPGDLLLLPRGNKPAKFKRRRACDTTWVCCFARMEDTARCWGYQTSASLAGLMALPAPPAPPFQSLSLHY